MNSSVKGLSNEMDLGINDIHGLNRGRGQFLNFFGAPMLF
jgi:hypothetical protein